MDHALAALVGHILDYSCGGLLVLTCFTVDPSSSSTFTTVAAGGFKIQYVDQTKSSGDYISDSFEIGGSLIPTLQMGLALHSTVTGGIMGIWYQTGESVSVNNRYLNLERQPVLAQVSPCLWYLIVVPRLHTCLVI